MVDPMLEGLGETVNTLTLKEAMKELRRVRAADPSAKQPQQPPQQHTHTSPRQWWNSYSWNHQSWSEFVVIYAGGTREDICARCEVSVSAWSSVEMLFSNVELDRLRTHAAVGFQ